MWPHITALAGAGPGNVCTLRILYGTVNLRWDRRVRILLHPRFRKSMIVLCRPHVPIFEYVDLLYMNPFNRRFFLMH